MNTPINLLRKDITLHAASSYLACLGVGTACLGIQGQADSISLPSQDLADAVSCTTFLSGFGESLLNASRPLPPLLAKGLAALALLTRLL